ncbi:MAG: SDR family oxidoreductase [Betaproteobacteria bacterium]|nr:SDR family oxidoreductase [Betaproteobacteria bacterium]
MAMSSARHATGKVALVTGAAGGIGAAIVTRLHAAGASIAALDVPGRLAPRSSRRIFRLAGDATVEADVSEAVSRTVERFGRLDWLVHTVGRVGSGGIEACSLAEWRSQLAVNLDSAFLFCREAAPHLAASRGAVVLFSSTNGRTGGSAVSGAAYAVAKAGIINLARFLARDWASAGVRVNCIAPGPVDTVMLDRLGEAGRSRLLKTIPLGRFSSADQVAAQVAFLLSDDCAAVSGEVFNTSGALVLD